MGRRPRIHYPGAIYHVMARGVDGRETFADDQDRRFFLTTLADIKNEASYTLFAYCLMGNHFHMAIKVGGIPLSHILQRLLTRYVSAFNNRHERTGHLFQARYKAILCLNESYLLRLVDYIHANPVRSGLVLKTEDWAWSSSKTYVRKMRTGLVDPDDMPLTLGFDSNICGRQGDFDPWPKESPPGEILLRNQPAELISFECIAEQVASSTAIAPELIRSSQRGLAIVSDVSPFSRPTLVAVPGGVEFVA